MWPLYGKQEWELVARLRAQFGGGKVADAREGCEFRPRNYADEHDGSVH